MMIKKAISLFIFTVFYGYINGNTPTIPEKITLDNGFSYIYDKNENSKNTVLQLAFYGGNSADPYELKGISQLASRMFIQVTGSQKIKNISSKNSHCYLRVKGDFIIITIEALSEYFNETIKIFFKTIAKPDITGLRLTFLKKRMEQMQTHIKGDYNNVLNETILSIFFKGSGYDSSIYGDKESLKSIKKKKTSNYHKENICLSNMVLSISTDLSKKKISKTLMKNLKYFSIGKKKNKEKFILIKTDKREIKKEIKGDLYTIANAFSLRFDNDSINRKGYLFAKMLETYLGKGIGSYLWTLRTDEYLTYSINSKAVFFEPFGYIYFLIKTKKQNINKTINLFKTLIDSLYKKGVDKQTLNSIISYTSASFLRQNELKRAMSYTLTFFEILGLGFDFNKDFYREIKEINLSDFNNYLKQTLNPSNRLSIILGE